MSGWTKQDYADNYKNGVEQQMRPPCPTNIRRSVTVAYIRKFIEPYIQSRRDTLIDLLPIRERDRVVMVGCGFGWGTEYLIEKTGCDAVGTDISDWIQSEKNNDESDEIMEEIVKVGLLAGSERAKQVLEFCLTPGTRAKSPVLNEHLLTSKSKARLCAAFAGELPTWLITEDMIQEKSDTEIVAWGGLMSPFRAKICHLHNGKPRTNEQLYELTGHNCFQYGINELLRRVS